MEYLISPREATDIIFGGQSSRKENMVSHATILSAQQKFIEPVFGKLTQAVAGGKYPLFHERYLKPALAAYIKMLVVPSSSVILGTAGALRPDSSLYKSATPTELDNLKRQARSEACALLQAAIGYVEDNQGDFPEYDSKLNIKQRLSICSGIVL